MKMCSNFEKYLSLRIQLAQITWLIEKELNTANATTIAEMQIQRSAVAANIKEMEEADPELAFLFLKQYMCAIKTIPTIPLSSDSDTNTFVKYLSKQAEEIKCSIPVEQIAILVDCHNEKNDWMTKFINFIFAR